ncbi:hypothetical protein GE21DRAFT_3793 [Neurospora crassa]|uniref:Uncharacterized protein n=1 Tax=Neurospora crassa (strain ATCC 24698 / 74-OR23-1A / CBS 708.71 / DSM 1257 / FGSC 987) TaxID=367110 RepID=Q7S1G5_NEUCR|nr:hypothetical protein NCU09506 [Neurospora crassa OR74A]EAA29199.2 hypothetical protein NCU09506 [Neurospora crassa OR74A]KHE81013.1 hypothetical protein GE21DRAFT_3793 [Neurospora crassa]|eukprot:XP_958435.2 hypothetical protein NCU09506 [Neurospora crassa OR74A]
MLARSAWTWIILFTGWASIVASKSPAAVYEMIFSYHIYNIAWQYRGADQEYIYRLLDPVKDDELFNMSYRKKGHRGSLAHGQMDWKEFCLAWFKDDTLGPEHIPELDPQDLRKTAAELKKVRDLEMVKTKLAAGKKQDVAYHELLRSWRKMIEEAQAHLGDSKIATDLKSIALATGRAGEVRNYEFWQMKYFGEDMRRQLPGIKLKSRIVSIPEFGATYRVFDFRATMTDPNNKAKMPKALGLSESSPWVMKYLEKISEYGVTAFGPKTRKQRELNRKSASHRRVLMAVNEFDRIANGLDHYCKEQ